MGNFVFNGVSAADMGLVVERYPDIPKPRRRVKSISIPGRSGDLHISDGSWEDVTIRYNCWFKNLNSNYPTARTAHEIAQWLYSSPVGARLEDTYDSLTFRKATFVGPTSIENVLDRFGRVTLEFRCDPRAFLKNAEKGTTFKPPGGIVNNQSPFPSLPLIRIIGAVGGLLQIGDSYMLLRFPGMDTHEFWLDCDEMEAWEVVDGQEVPSNAWIDEYNFPKVAPGANVIQFPETWESVTVWPRGYTV